MLPGLTVDPPIKAKVRTGIKENGRPKATGRFHSEDAAFTEMLGDPEEIVVSIPFRSAEDAFPTGMELWGGKEVLICYCKDTVTAHRLPPKGSEDSHRIDTPCTYPECGQYKAGKCKPVGRLRMRIPQLGDAIYQLETKGWYSSKNIYSALKIGEPIEKDQHFRMWQTRETNSQGAYYVIHMAPIERVAEVEGE